MIKKIDSIIMHKLLFLSLKSILSQLKIKKKVNNVNLTRYYIYYKKWYYVNKYSDKNLKI